MAQNSPSVGQSWTLLDDCFLKTVQLLTVEVQIKSLVVSEQLILDNFMRIKSKTKQKTFLIVNSGLKTVCAGLLPFGNDGFHLTLL